MRTNGLLLRSLPNGEAYTNPDGYRILNKAGSKLFRTYDDTGKLIGIAESKEKAMKKAQDEFAKKSMKEEPAASKSPTEMRFQPGDFVQKGLEDHPLRPILGEAFAFNPKKINEKYIKQANESAERLGGGSAFNPSRKSGDDGQAKLQLDGIRSSELRTEAEINQRILQDSPGGKLLAGGEHFTFIPDNKDYVIKTTQVKSDGNSGFTVDENVGKDFSTPQFRFLGFRHASVSEYVARTAEFSKIFDIPWQIVEIAQDKNGDPVIYSLMKKIEGTPLKDSSLDDRKAVKKLMLSKGFEYLGDSHLTFKKGYERLEGISYFNPKTGVLISDAEPRNFVRTKSGKIEPVDLMINKFPLEYNIRFQPISERELSTRWDSYPKTRGELTKPKILSALKGARNPPVSRDKLAKFVMTYDNPQDLMDHTYYHGTGNFISETVKPSITMSDRQAEQMGGGGYGEKYWAISLSKSKRVSETFAGQSRSVRVHPVLLKKSAKVIELPGIEDAAQLEDHIIDLWKNQVDAVWIGGGEQELAVTLHSLNRDHQHPP